MTLRYKPAILFSSPAPAAPLPPPIFSPHLPDGVQAELQNARQAESEAEADIARARKQLAALSERRREEEHVIAGGRQRAVALAREEAELRATATAARRESGEGREALTAARGELTELQETADKERRALESLRGRAVALESGVSRKREEDRFAREAADAQQARLDDIKREVGGVHFERKRVWRRFV